MDFLMNIRRGQYLMLITTVMFAFHDALLKQCASNLSPADILLWRSVVILPMIGLCKLMWPSISFITKAPVVTLLYATLSLGSIICVISALSLLSLPTFTFIFFLNPPVTFILSQLILKEKIARESLIALTFGAAGAALVIIPQGQNYNNLMGCMYAGLGCILFSLGTIYAKECSKHDAPHLSYGAFTIACFIYGFLHTTASAAQMGTSTWSFLILVSLVNMGGNFGLLYALKLAPLSKLIPIRYLRIFLSMIIGYMVWNDTPTPTSLLGVSLILLGNAILLYPDLLSRPKSHAA